MINVSPGVAILMWIITNPLAIWLVILFIDCFLHYLIVYFSFKKLGLDDCNGKSASCIIKVCLSGWLADIIGGFCVVIIHVMTTYSNYWGWDDITNPLAYFIILHPVGILWIGGCIYLSMKLIYKYNMRWALNKVGLTNEQKHYIARRLSFITAPYIFLVPTLMYLTLFWL